MLAGFKKDLAQLAEQAQSIGMSRDEYIHTVTEEAVRNGVDPPWAVSFDWQMTRSLYAIQLPHRGWWVQIDHHETLQALRKIVPTGLLSAAVIEQLTSADLEGEHRETTTAVAQAIREGTLDDGSQPLGISYRSKTLRGRCWAYWPRREDLALPPGSDTLVQLASENVGPDRAFVNIANDYGLPVLDAR